MQITDFVTLISGAGIGAILSAILVFVNNSKKNQLNYVVKERSEWRKSLQKLLDSLVTGNEISETIHKLKNRINPYGKYLTELAGEDYYLKDGHIWKLLSDVDIQNSEQIQLITEFIRLLWKYDWERSKDEINYNYVRALFFVIKFSSAVILLGSFVFAEAIKPYNLGVFSYFTAFILFLFNNIIIKYFNQLRWERRKRKKRRLSSIGFRQYFILGLALLPYLILIYAAWKYQLDFKIPILGFSVKIVHLIRRIVVPYFICVVFVNIGMIKYLSTKKIEYMLRIHELLNKYQTQNGQQEEDLSRNEYVQKIKESADLIKETADRLAD